ncbi:hypothetical protein H4R99_002190 [Coemansia sp. RSA 1722]|nr:hypothetical protein LPJ57_007402 [Coemansia sp. RSA 486]KAJ2232390.1 hypothetical protein IWW45_005006 [Coemansia sp. RSA 485]KAJ2603848.1 hypothetical protein H4R99_002190 [Coemansia sp. RSA 1722]
MGRTGQKLRANPPGSSLSPNTASPRSHPYALSLSTHNRVKTDAANASSATNQKLPGIGAGLASSELTSPSVSEATTPTINSSVNFEASISTNTNTSTGTTIDKPVNYMDDEWSPFNDPSIKQGMAQGLNQKPLQSLFDRSENMPTYTPMYTPIYPTGYASRQHIIDPNIYTRTTYEGYHFPREQITVRVLDVDSGEFLRQFPQR